MKLFAVSFTPAAVQDLQAIYDYIAVASGYASKAWDYIEKLEKGCHALSKMPLCGRARDDLMQGLRITPIAKKTVVAYLVDEKKSAVLILNIFYGGRDYETLMRD